MGGILFNCLIIILQKLFQIIKSKQKKFIYGFYFMFIVLLFYLI